MLLWLTDLRYADCKPVDQWLLSIRGSNFVDLALQQKASLGRPACMLACLLDQDAVLFDPNTIETFNRSNENGNVLSLFLDIMEDVEGFIAAAKRFARTRGKRVKDFKINMRKLRSAAHLFDRNADKYLFSESANNYL